MDSRNAVTRKIMPGLENVVVPDAGRPVICGFPVENQPTARILERVIDRANQWAGGWLVTLNLEMLSRIARDSDYRELLRRADMFVADGMPLVWASSLGRHRAGAPIPERTTGVDLVDRILKSREIPPFAILGGHQPGKALERYPGAKAACRLIFDGQVDLSEAQTREFATRIESSGARLVFLALGVPKQDRLALALRELTPGVVYIGVGGTFQMLSPQGKRAPRWMQAAGLEWFYRLTQEPRRLWRRYLGRYPVGASLLIRDTFFGPVW